jgi:hypothetical protein
MSAPLGLLALQHLASPEVAALQAWDTAVMTAWTLKLRPHLSGRLWLVLRRYRRTAAWPASTEPACAALRPNVREDRMAHTYSKLRRRRT